MFEITTATPATLTSVTPRTEVHGDSRVFAITIGLKLTGANTLLDRLSPTLRHALYMAVPDQEQLPGIEPATPLLRSRLVEEVKIAQPALEGWTLAIDHGIDETDPIKIGGCKVDRFRCVPSEGGSIELLFRVGSNDIDATEAGLLCSHLSQEISFTLVAPEKPAASIDGSTDAFKRDHPDAGDLFSEQRGDPEDEGSEGGDPDVDRGDEITGDGSGEPLPEAHPSEQREAGAWPFPRGEHAEQAPPQSVTTELSRRTARGRAATRAALETGRP